MKSTEVIPPILVVTILCVSFFGFSVSEKQIRWKSLFNAKDLSGWDTWLGPDLDLRGKPVTNKPLGLNNDPRHVFSIVRQDGENVIRISGENWGALSSSREYENYHLHLQFKWGTLTWGQKKNRKKDSGLLYHSVGSYGADYGAWMRSQEFQIEQTNCGDYWGVAGGMAEIPAVKCRDTSYQYSPGAELMTFKQGGSHGRNCVKFGDAENPTGKWNSIDLYCHGDTSIHVVNGRPMMVLYHNSQIENDQQVPLVRGEIQLQSEGAEIFYKDLKIESISGLPAEFLR